MNNKPHPAQPREGEDLSSYIARLIVNSRTLGRRFWQLHEDWLDSQDQ